MLVHYKLKNSQLYSQEVTLLTAVLYWSTLEAHNDKADPRHLQRGGGQCCDWRRSGQVECWHNSEVGASAGRWVSTQDSIISQCTGVYHFHSEGRRRTSTIGRSFAALDPAWRHHINNWQQCQEETPRWSSSCMWRGGTTKTQQNRRLGQRHNSWSSIPPSTLR